MAELADFDPTDGHLHGCTANDVRPCVDGCAGHLFTVAQDAEQSLAELRPVLLTDLEEEIINDAGKLWGKICAATPDGPSRDADLAELIPAIHLIQRYFMGQAAVRGYPGQYRGLGVAIDIRRRGPQIGGN